MRKHPRLMCLATVGLCIACALSLMSCSWCRPIPQTGETTRLGLGVGDRIRVHLADGRSITDTFVVLTDTELQCKFHVFEIGDVDCIERPLPRNLDAGLFVVAGDAVGLGCISPN